MEANRFVPPLRRSIEPSWNQLGSQRVLECRSDGPPQVEKLLHAGALFEASTPHLHEPPVGSWPSEADHGRVVPHSQGLPVVDTFAWITLFDSRDVLRISFIDLFRSAAFIRAQGGISPLPHSGKQLGNFGVQPIFDGRLALAFLDGPLLLLRHSHRVGWIDPECGDRWPFGRLGRGG